MKHKINMNLVAIAILAVAATVIGTTVIYYNLLQREVRTHLSVSAKLLRDTHYFGSAPSHAETISISTDSADLRISWIAADGTVLYDNGSDAEKLDNHLSRPEIQDALARGKGESIRTSDTLHKNTFYYAVKLENDTVLRVATDTESLWAVFVSAAPTIALIILSIIAICVVLSRILTRQLLRPVETMARNLERWDYEPPYPELAPFAETIHRQHVDILSAAKARQDFTANVSHELKTPLTAISGYSELLEDGMADPGEQKHFLQEIRKNVNRLLLLINDVIRLSELDRLENAPAFAPLDLYETIAECMEGLSVQARQRGVALSFEGGPCTIRGNRDMIKELAENLVQNAIRYTNEGGTVQVRVECREHPAFIVKDTGIGIPAAEQQRIFERFYRVDKSRSKATGGTGLGLAIVRHIVELHDARIELDSTPGVGTTIAVVF